MRIWLYFILLCATWTGVTYVLEERIQKKIHDTFFRSVVALGIVLSLILGFMTDFSFSLFNFVLFLVATVLGAGLGGYIGTMLRLLQKRKR